MEGPLLRKEHWRKSNQWFSLTARHAELIVQDTVAAAAFAECAAPPKPVCTTWPWPGDVLQKACVLQCYNLITSCRTEACFLKPGSCPAYAVRTWDVPGH